MYTKSGEFFDLSPKAQKATYEVSVPVTSEDIESIITTALEGDISCMWLGLDNSLEEWNDKPAGMPISYWVVTLLLENKKVRFYDIEDDTEIWELDINKLLKGISQNYKERPYDNNIAEGDSITADCILQFALFEELVFG